MAIIHRGACQHQPLPRFLECDFDEGSNLINRSTCVVPSDQLVRCPPCVRMPSLCEDALLVRGCPPCGRMPSLWGCPPCVRMPSGRHEPQPVLQMMINLALALSESHCFKMLHRGPLNQYNEAALKSLDCCLWKLFWHLFSEHNVMCFYTKFEVSLTPTSGFLATDDTFWQACEENIFLSKFCKALHRSELKILKK